MSLQRQPGCHAMTCRYRAQHLMTEDLTRTQPMKHHLPLYQRFLSIIFAIATLTAVILAVPASAFAATSATASSFSSVSWITLPGSITPGLKAAKQLQALEPAQQLNVTVTLRVRDTAELDRFLAAVNDPTSPSYHHFLTVQQFAQQYGPTQESRARTAAWLKSDGLQVVGTSANGLQLTARGRVSSIQGAFHSSLYTYKGANGTFVANSSALRIPASLGTDVLAVSGLSNAGSQQPAAGTTFAPRATINGHTPSDMTRVYNLDSVVARGSSGAGQTVAIASFADYSASNLSVYDQQFNITGNVSRVRVSDGTDTGAPLGAKNGEDEAEMDIEMVQGIVPRAQIVVYEAPNSEQGAISMYGRIVSDNRASVVTTSWGGVEASYTQDDINAIHQSIQEGAAQGQTFLAASGDAGAYDGAGQVRNGDTTLAVDYPASDPLVTGVGGTSLESNGTQYGGETAWSTDASQSPAGSGGGLSDIFPRPSYQTGPGVSNQYSNGMRQVPDVSSDADPATGFAVYTASGRNGTRWGVAGGTSMATPFWASFVVLLDGALGHRLGTLNPTIYALGSRSLSPSPFHDVTSGDNLYYPATVGWDFATGWGSMNGAAFLAALQSGTTTVTPSPTPTTVLPTLAIKQVLLLHTVNGKLQKTSALKVGEKGTLMILYSSAHAGSLRTNGTVLVRQNGKVVQTITLKPATYNGKPALQATVHYTSKKRVGTLLAHVTVKLGTVSSALDRAFSLVPTK